MKKSVGTGKKALILRFSIPYLLLLFVPLSMGLLTYNKSVALLGKEIETANISMLEQSKNMLDARMNEIAQIVRELKENPKIVHLQQLHKVMEGSSVYHVVETTTSLYHYSLSNNFIMDYFIVLKNSGVVLNERTAYPLQEFYNFYQFGQLTAEEWQNDYLNRFYNNAYLPTVTMVSEGKEHSVIPVIQTLGQPNNIQGAIMILLDSSKVESLLRDLHTGEGGFAYIADDNGHIITAYPHNNREYKLADALLSGERGSFETEIAGQNMVVTYNKSPKFKWTHVVAQPAQIVKENMYSYKRWTQTVMVVSLLLGAAGAILMAYRNSRPVKRLIQTIGERIGVEQSPVHDAFGMIQAGLTKLIDNNDVLHRTNAGLVERMREQASFLRFSLYERLLKGQIRSREQLDVLLQHAEVGITGDLYTVVIFDLHHYGQGLGMSTDAMKEMDVKKIAVKETIALAYGKQAHLHENEDQQIVFIVTAEGSGGDLRRQLAELLSRIQTGLISKFRLKTVIAVGDMADSLMDLPRCYEQAKQALTGHVWELDNQILWYESLPKDMLSYFYPADQEIKLINFAKAGDKEEIRNMLEELHRVNFETRQLPFYMIQMLIYDMWGTVLKLFEQVDILQDTVAEHIRLLGKEVRSVEDALHHYHAIYLYYEHVCDEMNSKKKSSNDRLIQEIKLYLDNEFKNTDLSLTLLSEKFMISEAYLSQFFKEQLGINFSDYLESRRLGYACKKLLATRQTINQISLDAGYNSANSFFKAFKRVHGMSPTEFRKHAAIASRKSFTP
ncbi:helix-turn-helix domain-containing protein [Paenibacillus piri]|nr:helix-turn-helix domain-containing protein [Paenibacillus piri]